MEHDADTDVFDTPQGMVLAKFLVYPVLITLLSIAAVAVILGGNARKRALRSSPIPMALFALLALISLTMTSYHRVALFRAWVHGKTTATPGNASLSMSSLLKDNSLFEEVWAAPCATPQRAWWSLQVFGFCANWSVLLATQETRKKIFHTWVFMLLGQLTAISYAANWFFMATMVYETTTGGDSAAAHYAARAPGPVVDPGEHSVSGERSKEEQDATPTITTSWSPSSYGPWHDILLCVTVPVSLRIPQYHGTATFFKLLLVPHLAAFLPIVLNGVFSPSSHEGLIPKRPSGRNTFYTMGIIMVVASYQVVSQGQDWTSCWAGVWAAFHEHPSVSIVGWDAICCWVGFGVWHHYRLG